jgi:hypothetical protein
VAIDERNDRIVLLKTPVYEQCIYGHIVVNETFDLTRGIGLIIVRELEQSESPRAFNDNVEASVRISLRDLHHAGRAPDAVHMALVHKIDPELDPSLKALVHECLVARFEDVKGYPNVREENEIQRKESESHAENFLNRSLMRPQ